MRHKHAADIAGGAALSSHKREEGYSQVKVSLISKLGRVGGDKGVTV